MSLYTSIIFTPVDRSWIATPDFIAGAAKFLRVEQLDYFTVYQGSQGMSPVQTGGEERYKKVLHRQNLGIRDALLLHQSGDDYWTHMVFPLGDFVKNLHQDTIAAIPDSLAQGFYPWDISISNGYWDVLSYDEGQKVDGGCCAVIISANGCPFDPQLYLNAFLTVSSVTQFRRYLEGLSSQPWEAIINVT